MHPVSIVYSKLSHSSLNKVYDSFETTYPTFVSQDQNQNVRRSVFFSRIASMVSILIAV